MRRKKKTTPAKVRHIDLRVDEKTYDFISGRARSAGLTLSEYMRKCAVEAKVVFKPQYVVELAEIQKLTAEFGKIGSNLNQIARYYNGGGFRSREMYDRAMQAISQLYEMKNQVEKLGGDIGGHSQALRQQKQ